MEHLLEPGEAPGGTARRSASPALRPTGGYLPDTTDWIGTLASDGQCDNDYLRDHDPRRTTVSTGIAGINLQDSGIQESMGPIIDRTHEHLGHTDS